MEQYPDIFGILRKYNYLGEQVLHDGTILIGKAPHVAPMAWLHNIYPALTMDGIERLQKELPVTMPDSFKEFLSITNGLDIFNSTFYLFGVRKDYNRTLEDVWQPYDIVTPNTLQMPKALEKKTLAIGGYRWDGSRLYMDIQTEKIFLCRRDKSKVLMEWQNLDGMIKSEVSRLVKLFDEKGKRINQNKSPLPV